MNFSALNTHAIGVISASAGVTIVEGAASFSAGASASAQATLHSHATAAVINSVALTTTQSVVRFAMATATLGCNAAANVEGYRVQFSNAEIVCAASSDANAVVYRQAAAFVTAQATNVAVGSRVAYASASLQAECDLTANSGVATFVSSVIAATAAMSSSSYVIWDATGAFTGSSLAISVGEKKAVAQTTLVASAALTAAATSGAFSSAQVTAQSNFTSTASIIHDVNASVSASSSLSTTPNTLSFVSAALSGSALITASSNSVVEASVTITAVSELTSTANLVVDVGAAFDSSSNVTAEAIAISGAQASVAGSSSLSSVSYNVSSASATFIGSSLAISVGHKKSVAHTTINANAAVSSAANSEVYNTASIAASAVVSSIAANYSSAQASCVAQSSVSSSAFNTANPNAAIIAHANTSATTSTTHFATANIDGSCVITTAPSLVIDVSASLSAFAVSISIGDKISVGHAQFTGSANLSSVAWATINAQVTIGGYAVVSSSAIAARIISAEAHVSDSSYVVPGYWIPEYDTYTYTTTTATIGAYSPVPSFRSVTDYGGTAHYFTGVYFDDFYLYQGANYDWTFTSNYSNSTAPTEQSTWGSNGSAVGSLGSGSGTNSSGENFTTGRYKGGQWGNNNHQQFVNIGGMGTVTVTHYVTSYRVLEDTVTTHTTTHPAVWVGPVTVYTGYTPNAQVVVSDATILSGSFAYPSASADVIATGLRIASVSADVTCLASAAAEAFTVRFIDASAAVTSEAGATSSASVDLFGSAQITATAQSTANGAKETFATGSFSGSSLAISVGHKIAVGQTSIACSASFSATANVERFTPIAINANANVDAVGDLTFVLAGQMTASASANIATTPSLHVYVAATVSASATAIADGDTLISATASVSTTQFYTEAVFHPAVITPGYWVSAVWEWVAAPPHFTTANGSYAYGNTGSGFRHSSTASSTWYQGSTVFRSYFTEQYVETAATYYVNPVTVSEAYTTPAFWTNTGYTPSANVSAEAIILLSVSLSASGSVSAEGFISVFAEAAVSGSSITISAGTHSVVVRADAIASANLSADSSVLRWASANLDPTASVAISAHVDSFRTASVVANANISETASKIAHAQLAEITGSSQFTESAVNFANSQGAFTGSSVTVSAAFQRAFAAIGVTSTASITAEADVEIWAKADVVASSVVAVTGMGVNSAHAYVTASSDMSAVANIVVLADAALSATADFVNGFAIVAQEGSRSNGILILVEAENRTIEVEVIDRSLIIELELRTVYAEAA